MNFGNWEAAEYSLAGLVSCGIARYCRQQRINWDLPAVQTNGFCWHLLWLLLSWGFSWVVTWPLSGGSNEKVALAVATAIGSLWGYLMPETKAAKEDREGKERADSLLRELKEAQYRLAATQTSPGDAAHPKASSGDAKNVTR